jgi:hypothetical protein
MANTDSQFWYTNETQKNAYYYIPQLEVTISTSGNQSSVTNIVYPIDVVAGSSLYNVNNGPWGHAAKLQSIGNSFYSAAVTGIYKTGDVIRTTYIAPDGSQFVGSTFQVISTQSAPVIDQVALSGLITTAVQNAVKNIQFSPTIILKAN